MNTHESYVSLETAKMLKEAGFDWRCTHYYTMGYNNIHQPNNGYIAAAKEFRQLFRNHNNSKLPIYSAPTTDVAQRWLREEKNINIEVKILSITSGQLMWYAKIYYLQKHGGIYDQVEFIQHTEISYDSYEEALEAGIQKCLTILLEE